MKVLLVGFYPPTPLPEGDYLQEIAKAVMAEGHDVTVVAPDDSEPREANPKIIPIAGDWRWEAVRRMAGRIVAEGPDIVAICYVAHLGGNHPAPTMLPDFLRRLGYAGRFVTIFSNPIGFSKRRFPLAAAGLKLRKAFAPADRYMEGYGSLLSADRIVCLSLGHARFVRGMLRRAKDRVVTFPPFSTLVMAPFDEESREEGRRLLGARPGETLVTYFGYLRPDKNVDLLIEAAARLENRKELRFVVAGAEDFSSPGYARSLEERAEALGVRERFTFTGPYPAGSLTGSLWLHGSDVCVLPMKPGVFLNNSSLAAALRHGLPTIVTSPPEPGEPSLDAPILRQVAEFVPGGDVPALAEAIDRLTRDPERMKTMRSSALQTAQGLYAPSVFAKAITTFDGPVRGIEAGSLKGEGS